MLAVLVALVASLLPAAAASARVASWTAIVPGHSIGDGVLLKSRATLERKLGDGQVVKRTRNDLGRFTTVRYADKRIDVTYRGTTAFMVLTEDGRYGTPKGIGVGATKAELKRAYPAVRCPSARLCSLGRALPGARITDFRLTRKGKVLSVMVGVVPD
jgi:hypothetical protein